MSRNIICGLPHLRIPIRTNKLATDNNLSIVIGLYFDYALRLKYHIIHYLCTKGISYPVRILYQIPELYTLPRNMYIVQCTYTEKNTIHTHSYKINTFIANASLRI